MTRERRVSWRRRRLLIRLSALCVLLVLLYTGTLLALLGAHLWQWSPFALVSSAVATVYVRPSLWIGRLFVLES